MLALAIAVVGQQGLWTNRSISVPGPRWVLSLTFGLMAVSVVLRRVRGLEALVFALAVFSIENVVHGSSQATGGFLAVTFLAYAVGAHEPWMRAVVGLAALTVAMVIHDAFDPLLVSPRDYVSALPFDVVPAAAWLSGAYLRTRRELLFELRGRADRAVLEERNRIARELHDVVAHGVTVMVLQAEAADEVMDSDPVAAHLAVQRVQETGRRSLVDLRQALGVLRSGEAQALAPQPDCAQLDTLVDRTRSLGLGVDVAWSGERELDRVVSVSVYRIVQEALTNVLRHARANRATVTIAVADTVRVVIDDDGVGAVSSPQSGSGIAGMRARAEGLGGSLHAGAAPCGGFRISVVIPRTLS